MKKIVLSIFVVGALMFSSCKKATEGAKELKDATTEAAGTVANEAKDAANVVAEGASDAANAVADGAKEAATKVKDGATDAANAVVEGAESAVEGAKEAVSGAKDSALAGITIPSFANEAVTKNLTEYATYAKDYIAANGNLGKISALAPKGAALLAEGKKLASKLDASELMKYKSVLSTIQSKMAPSK
ncbi:hypothetical protein MPF19_12765 [Polaribacter sp. Z014]|uniref:hypothetical protein n=1 Tax=Polaribacter sp. Z014 TaxID=2927126 RepID=UPI00201FB893|nr:hypothetical protein [Polaribacter sp. Z014]MCL7764291.1 hypothetical protein [Polaribacter sp. Z014]